MPTNDYSSLFAEAGIHKPEDLAKYRRFLDAALEQESIDLDEIIGLGEIGDGYFKNDLVVIDRNLVVCARERGVFNKRIELDKRCHVWSIADLKGTQEGLRGTDLILTARDSEGNVLTRFVWFLQNEERQNQLVLAQRQRVFELIREAMNLAYVDTSGPARHDIPPTSSLSS